ncbi:unnamed protein product [Bathycoccus prasinos]
MRFATTMGGRRMVTRVRLRAMVPCTEIQSLGEKYARVASGVCDFDTTDCFQTENYHSTNSAKGLSCAVKVTKTLNEDGSAYASGCSTYSNELP